MNTLLRALTGAAVVAAWTALPAVGQESKPTLAYMELERTPEEQPGPLAWLFPTKEVTLRQIVDRISDVAKSDTYQGLVIRLKDADLNLTQVEELGAAIREARSAGKKVQLYGDAY